MIISVGAFAALTTSVLGSLLSMPRIFFSMARDGLLSPWFAYVHPKYQTPLHSTLITGALAGTMTFFIEIETLAEMVSIGTLFAMLMVCSCVLTIRYNDPLKPSTRPAVLVCAMVVLVGMGSYLTVRNFWTSGLIFSLMALVPAGAFFLMPSLNPPRTFRCPGVPLIPILGIFSNIYLMANLATATWYRLVIWLVLGIVVYFGYGFRNSKLARRASEYEEVK